MLPRLLPFAVTPPAPRPSTITPLACVMTKSGADPARKATRATSAVGSSSTFAVPCLQPPASSLQPSPLTRATRTPRQSLRAFQPTANPSGSLQAATSPAALLPSDAGAKPVRTKPKTSQQPPQKLSTFLLITC